jgi:hypothetical protein
MRGGDEGGGEVKGEGGGDGGVQPVADRGTQLVEEDRASVRRQHRG